MGGAAGGGGLTGGARGGRCYPVWMSFSGCMSEAGDPKDCEVLRNDYLECLHHRKELKRINTINKQVAKNHEEKADALKAQVRRVVSYST